VFSALDKEEQNFIKSGFILIDMINRQVVLEHIAQTTKKSASDVGRAVVVEYWKDIINFTSARGVNLFADYLRERGIKEIRGTSRLVVSIPSSDLGETTSGERTTTFCIEGVYASQFRQRYESEFNFAP
jgi:SOS-response transcriptional repressor LexA